MKTEMKNTLIVALIAALTVSAQDEIQQSRTHWGAAGEMPAARKGRPDMHKRMLEKFDADKDGQLSEAEKEAMKAEFDKKRAVRGERGPRPEGMEHPGNRRRPHNERPEMLEKFDLDKDGKLSPEEHKALRDAAPRFRGERGEKNRKAFMDKFDADKDGKLNEAEKEAAKAKRRTNEKRSSRGKRPAAPATFEL